MEMRCDSPARRISKPYFRLAVLILAFGTILRASSIRQIPVQLVFPEVYTVSKGSVTSSELPLEIEFTLFGKEGIQLSLYVRNGRICAGPFVDLVIKDDKGHLLEPVFLMSMPEAPAGDIWVDPGEHLRVSLAPWNGITAIPKDGWYTIQAILHLVGADKNPLNLQSNEKRVHFILTKTAE